MSHTNKRYRSEEISPAILCQSMRLCKEEDTGQQRTLYAPAIVCQPRPLWKVGKGLCVCPRGVWCAGCTCASRRDTCQVENLYQRYLQSSFSGPWQLFSCTESTCALTATCQLRKPASSKSLSLALGYNFHALTNFSARGYNFHALSHFLRQAPQIFPW